MLNKSNERELAYVVKVGWVRPIEGADNIELIGINGWTCIAKIGEFKEGDLAVYFEIDSKLPEADWSEFMASKGYKVKTMKLNKFKVISQGLALPASTFGAVCYQDGDGTMYIHFDKNSVLHENIDLGEGEFLTKKLGVTYAVEEDNARKANNVDKYKKMAQRRPDIFKKPFVKWLYKYNWGKKLLFVFYGKKKDTRNWPSWVVKTDEERVQNMTWILNDKSPWFATEKIDGTSTTFTMKGFGKKREFYVCSRNVNFDTPEKKENGGYYDTNVYVEMANKYNVEEVLADILDTNKKDLDFVTLQGETYGEGIQKRTYGLKGHDFAAFNLIYGYKDGRVKRFNPADMTNILTVKYSIPCVPIVEYGKILPDTVEEILSYATGASTIDGGMREGIVFRDELGERSFKAVSNEFLLKYHNG